MQVECGDGNGPIKFMIQKAGSTDNTLGFNGWQSADHWFTANLDPQSNIEVGELVWVNLEASIIKHLSFTNYRISAKRDSGKVCAGVLSGGVISDRPDGGKKSVASSLVAPTSLSGDLPNLPEAFAKTQINVMPDRELPSESPKVVASEIKKAISLPDLPTAVQAPQKLDGHASVLNSNPQEKKKASPILFAAIGLALLGLAIGVYFLTKGSSAPINPSTSPQTTPAEEVKTSPGVSATPPAAAPSTVTPQTPKAPANNAPKPSSNAPAGPDLNKIVKDAINK